MKKIYGTVIWFAPFKGFGFIQGVDGNEIFVHSTDLLKKTILNVNDLVEYKIRNEKQGLKATNIKSC